MKSMMSAMVALVLGLGCYQAHAVTVPLVRDAFWSDVFDPGVAAQTQYMCTDYVSLAWPWTCVNYVGTTVPPWDEGSAQAALKFTLPRTSSVLSTARLYLKVMDRLGSPTATVTLTDDNNWMQTDNPATSRFPSLSNASVLFPNGSVPSTDWVSLALTTSALDEKIISSASTDATLIITGSTNANTYFNFVADDDASGSKAYLALTFKPQVQSVSAPANNTYKAGDALNFTVSFDSLVNVDGNPKLSLALNTGGSVQASYVSGSGTQNLVFRYTVASGDVDADGVTVGSLALNSGTIRSDNYDDAELTLYSVGATTGVKVDAVVPAISSVAPPADGTYTTGQNLDFIATFSEAVNVASGTPYIALTIGGVTKHAVYTSGSGTTALTFRYTLASGDAGALVVGSGVTLNGGTIKDAAGNAAILTFAAPTTTGITVDARPTQTINFGALGPQTYGTEFLKLTATTNCGLPVTYESANTSAVRISNDTAFLLAADTATITASQPGGTACLAATPASRILTIAKKPLTITGASAENKIYDGSTEATVAGAQLAGIVNADDVALVLGTATFATKDTGTAKPVTVTGSVLTGDEAGNYSLTEVSGLAANISPMSIEVRAFPATKIHGEADPLFSYMAGPLCTGDAFTGAIAREPGDSVGEYVIGLGTLSAGANYVLDLISAKLKVTKKPLAITGASAQNKIYDGTTVATVTGAQLQGVVEGDDVSLTLGSATFATKDTGTSKPVTVTGSVLTGAQAGNYTLTEVTGLSAKIQQATVSVTTFAASKVYGESDPLLSYASDPLSSGDVLTGAIAREPGDSVGEYVIGLGTLSAGANYVLDLTSGKLKVTKKPLNITGASAQNKTYDGTTEATVTGAQLQGVVEGDDVSLTLGSATFATKHAGTAKPVEVTGSVLSGAKAGNYVLTEVSGLAANISPRRVSVAAHAKSKVQGASDPELSYVATPLVGSDAWSGSLSRDPGEEPGHYPIRKGTLNAGSNYDIDFAEQDLTISKVSGLGSRPGRRPPSSELGVKVDRVMASMARGSGAGSLGGTGCRDNDCQAVEVVLPAPSRISVAIFDNLGNAVISLQEDIDGIRYRNLQPTMDGRKLLPVAWNLRSAMGSAVQPGVYLWKMEVVTEDGRKWETIKRLGVK